MKKVVHYVKNKYDCINKGCSTIVLVVDHPDFDENELVLTTEVLEYNEYTGEFETLNTLYKPVL